MVRIFMAPKFDERGSGYNFRDQRLAMIELDKFVTQRKVSIYYIFAQELKF